jgi:beta-fructofuranosidase
VFRHQDEWIMLMAAALPEQTAGVLQYRSSDLRSWSFDGVLASRRSDRSDEVWTGSLWECPQLTQVGDRWILTVSVWDDETLHYVAAAVGDYDGRTFHADRWQRLTYGDSAYAMAAFTDRDGRPCVMSWLREEPRNNDTLTVRAGAHSVASTIMIDDDGGILMRPHPDIDTLRMQPLGDPERPHARYDIGDSPADVVLTAAPGTRVSITEAEQTRAVLTVSTPGDELVIERSGFNTERLPLPAARVGTRIILDADIVEVFAGSSYGAYRISPAADPSAVALDITTVHHDEAVVRPLHV